MKPGVLITRPALQANQLMQLAQQQGFDPVPLPLLEIQPLKLAKEEVLAELDWARGIVFISANAVENLLKNLKDCTILQDKTIIAIGAKTASVLQHHQIPVTIQPSSGHTSEDLLQHPALSADPIQLSNILIVRGQGGRETLADTLRERGASIHYLEVYQRRFPSYDADHLARVLQHPNLDAILVTSQAALEHLLQLYQASGLEKILSCRLVVPSQRIAATAQQAGFRKAILVARSAADNDMLNALQSAG